MYSLFSVIFVIIYVSFFFIFFPFIRSAIIFYKVVVVASLPLLLGNIFLHHKKNWKKLKIKQAGIFTVIIVILFIGAIGFTKAKGEPYTFLYEPYEFSCSMYHVEKDFDIWWDVNQNKYEKSNITKEDFRKFPFSDGIVMSTMPCYTISGEDIEIGDWVAYTTSYGSELSHRVVQKWKANNTIHLRLLGDNNLARDMAITQEQVQCRFEETVLTKVWEFFLRDGCIK